MTLRIYALTDSHQEARNLSKILSGITNFEKEGGPFIVLDCGDLFKGIYNKDLSIDAYLKFKELNPNAPIFITIGNNDFGFDDESFEYYKFAVKKLEKAGINIVCANLKQGEKYSQLCSRYKILEINNKKILITGFCLNTSVVKRFGFEFENAQSALKNLVKDVKEKYDKLIILNHHWYPYSKALKDFATTQGIKIDLIIGGHEHSHILPDYKNNIYYPLAFARTLYKITLGNEIENIEEHKVGEFKLLSEFEEPLLKFEQETRLYKPIAKRVLNLWKRYSEPCALGTFISDSMEKAANTDIAFHSTGFTMYPLSTDDSDIITKYDFERVICASTPIVKIEINTEQLKKVFENATLQRMYKNNGNARFLQCSQNIKITGKGTPEDKTYKILQIEINGEKLLDEYQRPISDKNFTCAVDAFIASGEQGFNILKDLEKTPILINSQEAQLKKLLLESLIEAQNIYPAKSEYPTFEIIDL